MAICVDNVEKAHNVGVVHFLEERNLANGSGGNTLIFGLETDLLEGDNALVGRAKVKGFVNNTVRACEGRRCQRRVEISGDSSAMSYPRRSSPSSGSSPWLRLCE